VTLDVREHGSKDDPNYGKYHPNSGAATGAADDGDWNAPYPPQVARAIRHYTGEFYADVNARLRRTRKPMTTDAVGDIIVRLKEAYRPSPGPLDLYRGSAYTAFESVLPAGTYDAKTTLSVLEGKIGTIFSDPGFMSTSLATPIGQHKHREVRLLLHAPAGTPAINALGESQFTQEREVILPAGTKWRLDSVARRRGGIVVHGTVVQ
jgi:hypothetical protein